MTPDSGHIAEALLNALVDNELDAAEAARLAGHLDECPACRARSEALRETADLVRAEAPYFDLPPGLAESIFPPLVALSPPAETRGTVVRLFRKFAAPTISLAALAASLLLYIATPASVPLDDEAVSAHIRSLQGTHLIDVVSSDHHTVKPWFAGKLDFSPPVADFAAAGFALVGGRVDYLQHHDAAVLIYRHGKHVINLFVYPDSAAGDTAHSDGRGYNLLAWSRGGLRFVAVSDTDATELQRLAGLLRSS